MQQQVIAHWSGWGSAPHLFAEERFAEQRAELTTLLGADGYANAEQSTQYAHYTDYSVVREIWSAVTGLGFTSGRVLEPGCGSGNFIAQAPPGAQIVGIEKDPASAAVTRALYPQAEVRVESFADTVVRPGEFDLVIGNPPYGDVHLYDGTYNPKRILPIHDLFIDKAADALAVGGIMNVLTSRYTMDKRNPALRRALAASFDLIGAFRLHSGSHQKAAGTGVVMDLLILRKREPDREPSGIAFEHALPLQIGDTEHPDILVNEYFRAHPENVLGTMKPGQGNRGRPELSVTAQGELGPALRAALEPIIAQARANGLTYAPITPVQLPPAPQAPDPFGELRRYDGFLEERTEGQFTVMLAGLPEPYQVPSTQVEELCALIGLRDAAMDLLSAQQQSARDTENIVDLRERLGDLYDTYFRRWGPIGRSSPVYVIRRDTDAGRALRARLVREGHAYLDKDGKFHRRASAKPVLEAASELEVSIQQRRPPAVARIREDPFGGGVIALEDYDEETRRCSKADIFTTRVIGPVEPVLGVDEPADALAVCRGLPETGGTVRIDVIARLLGYPPEAEDQARAALGDLVYDDPETGELVPAADYLSGDVKTKLETAQAKAADDERFEVNIRALEQVIPADLPPSDIRVRMGGWIEPGYVERFLRELLGDDSVTVSLNGQKWKVKGGKPHSKTLRAEKYGTTRCDALALVELRLNQKDPEVRDALPDGGEVINQRETILASKKAEALDKLFAVWCWSDYDRAEALSSEYNERFNRLVDRAWTGEHLTLPWLSPTFSPKDYQLGAVERGLAQNVLLAHDPGAGKTAELIMIVMEMRRLGRVRKPVVVVPKHVRDGFEREWRWLCPQAKVLFAGEHDLSPKARAAFLNKARSHDWDAVVMTREQFTAVPMSPEACQQAITSLTAKIADFLGESTAEYEKRKSKNEDEDDGPKLPRDVKQLVKRLENFSEKLTARFADSEYDSGLTFEEVGFDYIAYDEAHALKNLLTISNIPEMANDGSLRSFDARLKIDYVREQAAANGKARLPVVAFATATPFSNSIPAEMYVFITLLQPDRLRISRIESPDAFAATYGAREMGVEKANSGVGNQIKTRLRRIINAPELCTLLLEVVDVKTEAQLGLKLPTLVGGREQIVTIEKSPVVTGFMQGHLKMREMGPARVQAPYVDQFGQVKYIRNKQGDVQYDEETGQALVVKDTILTVMTHANLASLDPRLVREPAVGQTKVTAAGDRIGRWWLAHRDDVYQRSDGTEDPVRGSLALVFCDIGVPGKHERSWGNWSIYEELREYVCSNYGMPREMFRFDPEAVNHRQRVALDAAARAGHVAVQMGSRETLGTGRNIQTRVSAIHHIDIPWKPSLIRQANGRGRRQGNQNEQIEIVNYIAPGTFDSKRLETNKRKSGILRAFMTGAVTEREIDDIGTDDEELSEKLAAATDNPLESEQIALELLIEELAILEENHTGAQHNLRVQINGKKRQIERNKDLLESLHDAQSRHEPTGGDEFSMTVDGAEFANRREAGDALVALIGAHHGRGEWTGQIGRLAGLAIEMQCAGRDSGFGRAVTRLTVEGIWGTEIDLQTKDVRDLTAAGVVMRLVNRAEKLDEIAEDLELATAELIASIPKDQAALEAPFEHAHELAEAMERLEEVKRELGVFDAPPPVVEPEHDADDEVIAVGYLSEADARTAGQILAGLVEQWRSTSLGHRIARDENHHQAHAFNASWDAVIAGDQVPAWRQAPLVADFAAAGQRLKQSLEGDGADQTEDDTNALTRLDALIEYALDRVGLLEHTTAQAPAYSATGGQYASRDAADREAARLEKLYVRYEQTDAFRLGHERAAGHAGALDAAWRGVHHAMAAAIHFRAADATGWLHEHGHVAANPVDPADTIHHDINVHISKLGTDAARPGAFGDYLDRASAIKTYRALSKRLSAWEETLDGVRYRESASDPDIDVTQFAAERRASIAAADAGLAAAYRQAAATATAHIEALSSPSPDHPPLELRVLRDLAACSERHAARLDAAPDLEAEASAPPVDNTAFETLEHFAPHADEIANLLDGCARALACSDAVVKEVGRYDEAEASSRSILDSPIRHAISTADAEPEWFKLRYLAEPAPYTTNSDKTAADRYVLHRLYTIVHATRFAHLDPAAAARAHEMLAGWENDPQVRAVALEERRGAALARLRTQFNLASRGDEPQVPWAAEILRFRLQRAQRGIAIEETGTSITSESFTPEERDWVQDAATQIATDERLLGMCRANTFDRLDRSMDEAIGDYVVARYMADLDDREDLHPGLARYLTSDPAFNDYVKHHLPRRIYAIAHQSGTESSPGATVSTPVVQHAGSSADGVEGLYDPASALAWVASRLDADWLTAQHDPDAVVRSIAHAAADGAAKPDWQLRDQVQASMRSAIKRIVRTSYPADRLTPDIEALVADLVAADADESIVLQDGELTAHHAVPGPSEKDRRTLNRSGTDPEPVASASVHARPVPSVAPSGANIPVEVMRAAGLEPGTVQRKQVTEAIVWICSQAAETRGGLQGLDALAAWHAWQLGSAIFAGWEQLVRERSSAWIEGHAAFYATLSAEARTVLDTVTAYIIEHGTFTTEDVERARWPRSSALGDLTSGYLAAFHPDQDGAMTVIEDFATAAAGRTPDPTQLILDCLEESWVYDLQLRPSDRHTPLVDAIARAAVHATREEGWPDRPGIAATLARRLQTILTDADDSRRYPVARLESDCADLAQSLIRWITTGTVEVHDDTLARRTGIEPIEAAEQIIAAPLAAPAIAISLQPAVDNDVAETEGERTLKPDAPALAAWTELTARHWPELAQGDPETLEVIAEARARLADEADRTSFDYLATDGKWSPPTRDGSTALPLTITHAANSSVVLGVGLDDEPVRAILADIPHLEPATNQVAERRNPGTSFRVSPDLAPSARAAVVAELGVRLHLLGRPFTVKRADDLSDPYPPRPVPLTGAPSGALTQPPPGTVPLIASYTGSVTSGSGTFHAHGAHVAITYPTSPSDGRLAVRRGTVVGSLLLRGRDRANAEPCDRAIWRTVVRWGNGTLDILDAAHLASDRTVLDTEPAYPESAYPGRAEALVAAADLLERLDAWNETATARRIIALSKNGERTKAQSILAARTTPRLRQAINALHEDPDLPLPDPEDTIEVLRRIDALMAARERERGKDTDDYTLLRAARAAALTHHHTLRATARETYSEQRTPTPNTTSLRETELTAPVPQPLQDMFEAETAAEWTRHLASAEVPEHAWNPLPDETSEITKIYEGWSSSETFRTALELGEESELGPCVEAFLELEQSYRRWQRLTAIAAPGAGRAVAEYCHQLAAAAIAASDQLDASGTAVDATDQHLLNELNDYARASAEHLGGDQAPVAQPPASLVHTLEDLLSYLESRRGQTSVRLGTDDFTDPSEAGRRLAEDLDYFLNLFTTHTAVELDPETRVRIGFLHGVPLYLGWDRHNGTPRAALGFDLVPRSQPTTLTTSQLQEITAGEGLIAMLELALDPDTLATARVALDQDADLPVAPSGPLLPAPPAAAAAAPAVSGNSAGEVFTTTLHERAIALGVLESALRRQDGFGSTCFGPDGANAYVEYANAWSAAREVRVPADPADAPACVEAWKQVAEHTAMLAVSVNFGPPHPWRMEVNRLADETDALTRDLSAAFGIDIPARAGAPMPSGAARLYLALDGDPSPVPLRPLPLGISNEHTPRQFALNVLKPWLTGPVATDLLPELSPGLVDELASAIDEVARLRSGNPHEQRAVFHAAGKHLHRAATALDGTDLPHLLREELDDITRQAAALVAQDTAQRRSRWAIGALPLPDEREIVAARGQNIALGPDRHVVILTAPGRASAYPFGYNHGLGEAMGREDAEAYPQIAAILTARGFVDKGKDGWTLQSRSIKETTRAERVEQVKQDLEAIGRGCTIVHVTQPEQPEPLHTSDVARALRLIEADLLAAFVTPDGTPASLTRAEAALTHLAPHQRDLHREGAFPAEADSTFPDQFERTTSALDGITHEVASARVLRAGIIPWSTVHHYLATLAGEPEGQRMLTACLAAASTQLSDLDAGRGHEAITALHTALLAVEPHPAPLAVPPPASAIEVYQPLAEHLSAAGVAFQTVADTAHWFAFRIGDQLLNPADLTDATGVIAHPPSLIETTESETAALPHDPARSTSSDATAPQRIHLAAPALQETDEELEPVASVPERPLEAFMAKRIEQILGQCSLIESWWTTEQAATAGRELSDLPTTRAFLEHWTAVRTGAQHALTRSAEDFPVLAADLYRALTAAEAASTLMARLHHPYVLHVHRANTLASVLEPLPELLDVLQALGTPLADPASAHEPFGPGEATAAERRMDRQRHQLWAADDTGRTKAQQQAWERRTQAWGALTNAVRDDDPARVEGAATRAADLLDRAMELTVAHANGRDAYADPEAHWILGRLRHDAKVYRARLAATAEAPLTEPSSEQDLSTAAASPIDSARPQRNAALDPPFLSEQDLLRRIAVPDDTPRLSEDGEQLLLVNQAPMTPWSLLLRTAPGYLNPLQLRNHRDAQERSLLGALLSDPRGIHLIADTGGQDLIADPVRRTMLASALTGPGSDHPEWTGPLLYEQWKRDGLELSRRHRLQHAANEADQIATRDALAHPQPVSVALSDLARHAHAQRAWDIHQRWSTTTELDLTEASTRALFDLVRAGATYQTSAADLLAAADLEDDSPADPRLAAERLQLATVLAAGLTPTIGRTSLARYAAQTMAPDGGPIRTLLAVPDHVPGLAPGGSELLQQRLSGHSLGFYAPSYFEPSTPAPAPAPVSQVEPSQPSPHPAAALQSPATGYAPTSAMGRTFHESWLAAVERAHVVQSLPSLAALEQPLIDDFATTWQLAGQRRLWTVAPARPVELRGLAHAGLNATRRLADAADQLPAADQVHVDALTREAGDIVSRSQLVYDIAAVDLPGALERVEKANTRAERANIPERMAVETETYLASTTDPRTHIVTHQQRARLYLDRPTLRYNGWQFIATLTWDEEAGLVTRVVPGEHLAHRPDERMCDHCHTRRERKDTYVVRHEDGSEKQVGSSCIASFLGIRPAGLWMLEWDDLADYEREHDDDSERASGREEERRYDVRQVIGLTIAVVGEHGYISRRQAGREDSPGLTATATQVSAILNPPEPRFDSAEYAAWRDRMHASAHQAHATTDAVLSCVAALEDESDYEVNLKAVAGATSVAERNLGLLVSAYSCYARTQESADRFAHSAYLGTESEKLSATDAEITALRVLEGDYGMTTIVTLDADGNRVEWFASGLHRELAVGDPVTATGTVKSHSSEFMDIPTTRITRASLTPRYAPDPPLTPRDLGDTSPAPQRDLDALPQPIAELLRISETEVDDQDHLRSEERLPAYADAEELIDCEAEAIRVAHRAGVPALVGERRADPWQYTAQWIAIWQQARERADRPAAQIPADTLTVVAEHAARLIATETAGTLPDLLAALDADHPAPSPDGPIALRLQWIDRHGWMVFGAPSGHRVEQLLRAARGRRDPEQHCWRFDDSASPIPTLRDYGVQFTITDLPVQGHDRAPIFPPAPERTRPSKNAVTPVPDPMAALRSHYAAPMHTDGTTVAFTWGTGYPWQARAIGRAAGCFEEKQVVQWADRRISLIPQGQLAPAPGEELIAAPEFPTTALEHFVFHPETLTGAVTEATQQYLGALIRSPRADAHLAETGRPPVPESFGSAETYTFPLRWLREHETESGIDAPAVIRTLVDDWARARSPRPLLHDVLDLDLAAVSAPASASHYRNRLAVLHDIQQNLPEAMAANAAARTLNYLKAAKLKPTAPQRAVINEIYTYAYGSAWNRTTDHQSAAATALLHAEQTTARITERFGDHAAELLTYLRNEADRTAKLHALREGQKPPAAPELWPGEQPDPGPAYLASHRVGLYGHLVRPQFAQALRDELDRAKKDLHDLQEVTRTWANVDLADGDLRVSVAEHTADGAEAAADLLTEQFRQLRSTLGDAGVARLEPIEVNGVPLYVAITRDTSVMRGQRDTVRAALIHDSERHMYVSPATFVLDEQEPDVLATVLSVAGEAWQARTRMTESRQANIDAIEQDLHLLDQLAAAYTAAQEERTAVIDPATDPELEIATTPALFDTNAISSAAHDDQTAQTTQTATGLELDPAVVVAPPHSETRLTSTRSAPAAVGAVQPAGTRQARSAAKPATPAADRQLQPASGAPGLQAAPAAATTLAPVVTDKLSAPDIERTVLVGELTALTALVPASGPVHITAAPMAVTLTMTDGATTQTTTVPASRYAKGAATVLEAKALIKALAGFGAKSTPHVTLAWTPGDPTRLVVQSGMTVKHVPARRAEHHAASAPVNETANVTTAPSATPTQPRQHDAPTETALNEPARYPDSTTAIEAGEHVAASLTAWEQRHHTGRSVNDADPSGMIEEYLTARDQALAATLSWEPQGLATLGAMFAVLAHALTRLPDTPSADEIIDLALAHADRLQASARSEAQHAHIQPTAPETPAKLIQAPQPGASWLATLEEQLREHSTAPENSAQTYRREDLLRGLRAAERFIDGPEQIPAAAETARTAVDAFQRGHAQAVHTALEQMLDALDHALADAVRARDLNLDAILTLTSAGAALARAFARQDAKDREPLARLVDQACARVNQNPDDGHAGDLLDLGDQAENLATALRESKATATTEHTSTPGARMTTANPPASTAGTHPGTPAAAENPIDPNGQFRRPLGRPEVRFSAGDYVHTSTGTGTWHEVVRANQNTVTVAKSTRSYAVHSRALANRETKLIRYDELDGQRGESDMKRALALGLGSGFRYQPGQLPPPNAPTDDETAEPDNGWAQAQISPGDLVVVDHGLLPALEVRPDGVVVQTGQHPFDGAYSCQGYEWMAVYGHRPTVELLATHPAMRDAYAAPRTSATAGDYAPHDLASLVDYERRLADAAENLIRYLPLTVQQDQWYIAAALLDAQRHHRSTDPHAEVERWAVFVPLLADLPAQLEHSRAQHALQRVSTMAFDYAARLGAAESHGTLAMLLENADRTQPRTHARGPLPEPTPGNPEITPSIHEKADTDQPDAVHSVQQPGIPVPSPRAALDTLAAALEDANPSHDAPTAPAESQPTTTLERSEREPSEPTANPTSSPHNEIPAPARAEDDRRDLPHAPSKQSDTLPGREPDDEPGPLGAPRRRDAEQAQTTSDLKSAGSPPHPAPAVAPQTTEIHSADAEGPATTSPLEPEPEPSKVAFPAPPKHTSAEGSTAEIVGGDRQGEHIRPTPLPPHAPTSATDAEEPWTAFATSLGEQVAAFESMVERAYRDHGLTPPDMTAGPEPDPDERDCALESLDHALAAAQSPDVESQPMWHTMRDVRDAAGDLHTEAADYAGHTGRGDSSLLQRVSRALAGGYAFVGVAAARLADQVGTGRVRTPVSDALRTVSDCAQRMVAILGGHPRMERGMQPGTRPPRSERAFAEAAAGQGLRPRRVEHVERRTRLRASPTGTYRSVDDTDLAHLHQQAAQSARLAELAAAETRTRAAVTDEDIERAARMLHPRLAAQRDQARATGSFLADCHSAGHLVRQEPQSGHGESDIDAAWERVCADLRAATSAAHPDAAAWDQRAHAAHQDLRGISAEMARRTGLTGPQRTRERAHHRQVAPAIAHEHQSAGIPPAHSAVPGLHEHWNPTELAAVGPALDARGGSGLHS